MDEIASLFVSFELFFFFKTEYSSAQEIHSVFLYLLVFQVFKPIVEKFNFTFNCDIKKR